MTRVSTFFFEHMSQITNQITAFFLSPDSAHYVMSNDLQQARTEIESDLQMQTFEIDFFSKNLEIQSSKNFRITIFGRQ